MWYVGPLAIVPSLYGLVVCMFLFTTLAFVATLVRFYTRAFLIHRQGWDDWFMILTMVFSLFFFVSVCFRKSNCQTPSFPPSPKLWTATCHI